ncbi:MAG: hypothetical protein GPJ54_14830 [Candidatus Heimdallarchaeota archaeon]|nr:hypothetical protein [Candidatus Heimdallarchaeota archaeon]
MAITTDIEHSPYFNNHKFNTQAHKFFENEEAKNINSIFLYLLNLLFDPIFTVPNSNNQFGKAVFMISRDGWVTPGYFLNKMKWDENTDNLQLITAIFDLFVEFEVLEYRKDDDDICYKFLKDTRIMDKSKIEFIKKYNCNMVYVMEDLTKNIMDIIIKGSSKCDKSSRSMAIIWEALRHDPYIFSFKRESIKLIDKLVNIDNADTLTIVDYSMDSGITSILLIDYLSNKYENIKLKFYCFEEQSMSINKSSNNIYMHLREKENFIRDRGLDVQIQFSQISIGNPTGLADGSIDLVLLPNILHYIPESERDQFFQYTRMFLKKHGVVLMTQFTALSNRITHPLYVLFNQFSDFYGLPLVEEMKNLHKKHFKEAKSAILDTVWYFKKPRN